MSLAEGGFLSFNLPPLSFGLSDSKVFQFIVWKVQDRRRISLITANLLLLLMSSFYPMTLMASMPLNSLPAIQTRCIREEKHAAHNLRIECNARMT